MSSKKEVLPIKLSQRRIRRGENEKKSYPRYMRMKRVSLDSNEDDNIQKKQFLAEGKTLQGQG